jgi:hypothetical protein
MNIITQSYSFSVAHRICAKQSVKYSGERVKYSGREAEGIRGNSRERSSSEFSSQEYEKTPEAKPSEFTTASPPQIFEFSTASPAQIFEFSTASPPQIFEFSQFSGETKSRTKILRPPESANRLKSESVGLCTLLSEWFLLKHRNHTIPYFMSPETANNSLQSIHNILTTHEIEQIMESSDYHLPTNLPSNLLRPTDSANSLYSDGFAS